MGRSTRSTSSRWRQLVARAARPVARRSPQARCGFRFRRAASSTQGANHSGKTFESYCAAARERIPGAAPGTGEVVLVIQADIEEAAMAALERAEERKHFVAQREADANAAAAASEGRALPPAEARQVMGGAAPENAEELTAHEILDFFGADPAHTEHLSTTIVEGGAVFRLESSAALDYADEARSALSRMQEYSGSPQQEKDMELLAQETKLKQRLQAAVSELPWWVIAKHTGSLWDDQVCACHLSQHPATLHTNCRMCPQEVDIPDEFLDDGAPASMQSYTVAHAILREAGDTEISTERCDLLTRVQIVRPVRVLNLPLHCRLQQGREAYAAAIEGFRDSVGDDHELVLTAQYELALLLNLGAGQDAQSTASNTHTGVNGAIVDAARGYNERQWRNVTRYHALHARQGSSDRHRTRPGEAKCGRTSRIKVNTGTDHTTPSNAARFWAYTRNNTQRSAHFGKLIGTHAYARCASAAGAYKCY